MPGRKTDVSDATWLADLLAHGLLRGSFVAPEPIQELRDLTRTRKQLVKSGAGSSGSPGKLSRKRGTLGPLGSPPGPG